MLISKEPLEAMHQTKLPAEKNAGLKHCILDNR